MHEYSEIFQELIQHIRDSLDYLVEINMNKQLIENSGIFIYLKVNFSEKSIVNCINFGFYHLFSSDFRFRCK